MTTLKWWNSTTSAWEYVAVGDVGPQGIQGPQGVEGPVGATPVISVVGTTLPTGSDATAIINNDSPATPTITFGLPTGATGPTNVLNIGTVTSGTTAAATITGTAPSQVLNLVLPKGDQGIQGIQGQSLANIDGGLPDSVYVGVGPFDCGGAV